MIKACIFDLDGTLLDTLNSITYYLNKTLSHFGFCETEREKVRLFVGDGARLLVERALSDKGVCLIENQELKENFLTKYLTDYNKSPAYLTEPYEGICDMLKGLKSLGISLAVLSNKPHSTTAPLVERLFPGIFDVVFGARDGVALKPSPEAAYDICERLGVMPSEVAYFGDTAVDMKTAKNFGAHLSFGVLWGFRDKEELIASGADITPEAPAEIIDIIKEKI